jgi:hypothetical protein
MKKTLRGPAANLEVLFQGKDIAPEKLPLRLISDTLSAVQRLASGLDADEVSQVPDEDAIGLIGVKRGSAIYQCFAHNPRAAIRNIRLAGELIQRPKETPDVPFEYVINPVHVISRTAAALNCTILVRATNQAKEVLAGFDKNAYDLLARHHLATGSTSITGVVIRAGGATTEKCAFRIAGRRRLMYCTVATRELARRLGRHLYETVLATGTAQWVRRNWKMVSFEVTDVTVTKRAAKLSDAMKALYEAGGSAWDSVQNPEDVIGGMR